MTYPLHAHTRGDRENPNYRNLSIFGNRQIGQSLTVGVPPNPLPICYRHDGICYRRSPVHQAALELRRKNGGQVGSVRQVAHICFASLGQGDLFVQNVIFTARLSGEAQEGDIVVSNAFKKDVDSASKPEHGAMQWERIIGVSFKGFPDKFDLWRFGKMT